MQRYPIRTDLATEAQELWRENTQTTDAIPGVEAADATEQGFRVTTVRILDEEGEKALCKPIGAYVTLELDALIRREEDSFPRAAQVLASHIRSLLQLEGDERILVAGLGNSAITPDAIGPESIDYVLVTRHLKQRMPESFGAFREVCAVRTGVLGTTGMESAEVISSLSERLQPDRVIVTDALASRRMERLCRTVQLSDTGIVPGSGVGNHRAALNRDTLGVPVLAIGVPTVVEAATLAAELAGKAGITEIDRERFGADGGMIVTPRDIDRSVHDAAKLIGYAVNLAVHEGLTVEDVDMFL